MAQPNAANILTAGSGSHDKIQKLHGLPTGHPPLSLSLSPWLAAFEHLIEHHDLRTASDDRGLHNDWLCMSRRVVYPAVAAVILYLVGALMEPDGLRWAEIGRWLRAQDQRLAVALLGGAFMCTAIYRVFFRPRVRRLDQPAPPLSWWVVAAGATAVAAVAWGATAWLLGEAGAAKDPAAARIEAIKTGLSIGAGTGGVFALLLAVRRQWHQEVTGIATELDASEKRVTDLYTKAADQLGSDKAPVRLAGLYALERVAQNNPTQRQTIVNVLCAYLRMPYRPPTSSEKRLVSEQNVERIQELEVRLTAQRLLEDHTNPNPRPVPLAPTPSRSRFRKIMVDTPVNPDPREAFWPKLHVDLTGASLIDFSFDGCEVEFATFNQAEFYGRIKFTAARFTAATFVSATFEGEADFTSTTFRTVDFAGSTFKMHASFKEAKFGLLSSFNLCTFEDSANFKDAAFPVNAFFMGADFGSTTDEELPKLAK